MAGADIPGTTCTLGARSVDDRPPTLAGPPAGAFDVLPDPVVVLDDQMRLVDANRAAELFFGVRSADWAGRVPLELIHREDVAIVLSSFEEVKKKAAGTPIELRVRAHDGSWRLVELIGGSYQSPDGLRIVSTLRDLTQRRRWEVAAAQPERFRTLVENAATIIMLIDADGRVHSVSGAVTRQLGHDPTLVVGSRLADWVVDSERERAHEELARALSKAGTSLFELELAHRDGRAVPYQFSVVNLLDDPVVAGLVISAHDISARRELEDRLAHLAAHDPLTGLANRTALLEHLAAARTRVRQAPEGLVVFFVDLDRFKSINDLYGHDIGDRMLLSVARRLRAAVRPGDFVARFGGDEFVVVCDELDASATAVVAARLETVISDPVNVNGLTLQIFASVGAVDGSLATDGEALLAEADAAMYVAKLRRRGEEAPEPMPVAERRELAEALRHALERDPHDAGLRLHYQPVVTLPGGIATGAEALVRWQHPTLGALAPAHFLPVADEAGLSARLGAWVLREAISCLHTLDLAGIRLGMMAVNLAPAQLVDPELPDLVTELLELHDIDPGRLCLEMTESAMLEREEAGSVSAAAARLQALKFRGVALAIDDFGTGFSSLVHVRDLPFDHLKIDKSFVDDVDTAESAAGICEAVVALAHATGKRVIAEGVARIEQHERMVEIGADCAQGFLYSHPVPADELDRALRATSLLPR
jgi:diguanylate cyclase (GGDEF)-like protein/PAS domain S-box-containing protein